MDTVADAFGASVRYQEHAPFDLVSLTPDDLSRTLGDVTGSGAAVAHLLWEQVRYRGSNPPSPTAGDAQPVSERRRGPPVHSLPA